MRKNYSWWPLAAVLFASSATYGQSVGIGTTSPNTSAQLDITSSSRGLLIPRMDSATILTIANPAKGLLVYDSSRNQLLVNMGTPASPNWQNIVASSGWSLSGNSGTNGNAFIGTTDATPLVFKTDNNVVAKFDIDDNVALGSGAMANGGSAGSIAIGTGALQQPSQNCIALGYIALAGNTGFDNIGIGQQTLNFNTGSGNVALGFFSLVSNTTASNNVAVGTSAAEENTTGGDMVAIGNLALGANRSGNDNTAIGNSALAFNNTGSGNTAVGSYALERTTNSYYNTVVGYNSGEAYDNGYNNVFVGANCDVNGAGYFNVIAIGQATVCTASDQARFGNPATNSIGSYADWTNFSDSRYKRNMRENVKGLDFIMRLRPITYNLDVTGIRHHLGQADPKDAPTQQSIRNREATVFSGFAAQEVEQAASASGYDFSGVDKPKNANDFYGLRYGDFVVPLVKAVQEQQAMIKALTEKVEQQDKQIQQLLSTKK